MDETGGTVAELWDFITYSSRATLGICLRKGLCVYTFLRDLDLYKESVFYFCALYQASVVGVPFP